VSMKHILVRPDVAKALQQGRAVVALESTVIAHGLPRPDNLETAQAMEQAIADAGAVPATIGVVGGRIKVGLEADELARFAEADDIAKLSSRDLGAAVALGTDGATTVAATMIAAARAGIHVFATGGIGGVHRGAHESFDVSADIVELGRTPVLVVCSGAKSILDLPKTLEMLETEAVPVLGYQTDRLPAFHARDSGLDVPTTVSDPREVAEIADTHWELGLGGVVLANPVPQDAAIPRGEIEAWIDAALAEADRAGVTGKEVTPFLLGRLAVLSSGRTLAANKALLIDNAGLAAKVALAIKTR